MPLKDLSWSTACCCFYTSLTFSSHSFNFFTFVLSEFQFNIFRCTSCTKHILIGTGNVVICFIYSSLWHCFSLFSYSNVTHSLGCITWQIWAGCDDGALMFSCFLGFSHVLFTGFVFFLSQLHLIQVANFIHRYLYLVNYMQCIKNKKNKNLCFFIFLYKNMSLLHLYHDDLQKIFRFWVTLGFVMFKFIN